MVEESFTKEKVIDYPELTPQNYNTFLRKVEAGVEGALNFTRKLAGEHTQYKKLHDDILEDATTKKIFENYQFPQQVMSLLEYKDKLYSIDEKLREQWIEAFYLLLETYNRLIDIVDLKETFREGNVFLDKVDVRLDKQEERYEKNSDKAYKLFERSLVTLFESFNQRMEPNTVVLNKVLNVIGESKLDFKMKSVVDKSEEEEPISDKEELKASLDKTDKQVDISTSFQRTPKPQETEIPNPEDVREEEFGEPGTEEYGVDDDKI